MEEQEIKQKIIEILLELEKIEDKKENQEKIFEIIYGLRVLREEENEFRRIFVNKDEDKDLKDKKYPNAFIILHKYLVADETNACLEHNNKLKEQKDKELEKK